MTGTFLLYVYALFLLFFLLKNSKEKMIITGKIIEKISPFFKSPPKASVIQPIIVGPEVQPISPATARNANIAIVAFGITFVVKLIVAGHIADTARPHKAHPAREITGLFVKQASIYDAMHPTADTIR